MVLSIVVLQKIAKMFWTPQKNAKITSMESFQFFQSN